MPTDKFDSFRAELAAIRDAINNVTTKTVRDYELRERVRTLFRIWISSIQPLVESISSSQRNILKLTAELEALAALANKIKWVAEYRKRIRRSIELADNIVLFIPPEASRAQVGTGRSELFLENIPDLPLTLVPNALLGWRESIRSFLQKHPFDRSVFVMVRYRKKNDELITSIKKVASKAGYEVILARDHHVTDDLYNPIACLLACARGLAIFDQPEPEQVFNPNVAYELGMMHLLGRECRVLKHESLSVLHTDILMKLYEKYNDLEEAVTVVEGWLGT